MKEYNQEEKIALIDIINQIQRFIFKYKRENNREPNQEEISEKLNISIEKLNEINEVLEELKRQDEEIIFKPNHIDKDRVEKARAIRKAKKENGKNINYL